MNKKLFAVIAALLLVLSVATPAFCTNYNNWGNTDLNILLGRELPFDLVYKGVERGGVSTIVSQVSKLTSTNLAFSVLLLSGASKTFSMANDTVPGKEITLVKNEHDARVLKLDMTIDGGSDNPTHTGFDYVTFGTAKGSFVTLAWIDSTTGWIITGANDVTIGSYQ